MVWKTLLNPLIRNFTVAMTFVYLLTSCVTVPQQLKGDYPALNPDDIKESDLQTPVRWGGVILDTRPESDHTCFEILARKLDTSMRPDDIDQVSGRFIACKPGFYDPEVFAKDREVTVTGKVIYIDIGKVGDYDYPYPVVDIEFMSLWPERINAVYYHHWVRYRPYYWHYPRHGFYYPYRY